MRYQRLKEEFPDEKEAKLRTVARDTSSKGRRSAGARNKKAKRMVDRAPA